MTDTMYFKPILMQDAQTGNGNGTVMPVYRATTATIQIAGTFTGTVNFEVTQDGTNWVSILGRNPATGLEATTTTTTGIWRFNVGGLESLRTRTSSMTAGSVTITGRNFNAPVGPEAGSGTVVVTSGTINKTEATGSGAISVTHTVSGNERLTSVLANLSAAPTTSENFTVTLDAAAGAAYDTVLFTRDPSTNSDTDLVYGPDGQLDLKDSDKVVVAYGNSDTATYGVTVTTEDI